MGCNAMDTLPDELIEKIYSYLSVCEFLCARAVCRSWARVRYPIPVRPYQIMYAEKLFRKIIYRLEYVYEHGRQMIVFIKTPRADQLRIWGHSRKVIEQTIGRPVTLRIAASVRILDLTIFGTNQIIWSHGLRQLVIVMRTGIVRPSTLPEGLKYVQILGRIAAEPFPSSVTDLRVEKLHDCFLREGLLSLAYVVLSDPKRTYHMPSTLEHLVILNNSRAAPNVLLNRELKHLECRKIVFEHLPPALEYICCMFRDASDIRQGMFPKSLRHAQINGQLEWLVGAFCDGRESLEVVATHGLMGSPPIPMGVFCAPLVNLKLELGYRWTGSVFAPGALPATLVRLCIIINVAPCIDNLPEGLMELTLKQYEEFDKWPLGVVYPPNLRVLRDAYRGPIPDSVVSWRVRRLLSDDNEPFVMPTTSNLKYVYTCEQLAHLFVFQPHVRVTYI